MYLAPLEANVFGNLDFLDWFFVLLTIGTLHVARLLLGWLLRWVSPPLH